MIKYIINKLKSFFVKKPIIKKKREKAVRKQYVCANCNKEFWAYPSEVAQFEDSLVYCNGTRFDCGKTLPPIHRSDEEIAITPLKRLNMDNSFEYTPKGKS